MKAYRPKYSAEKPKPVSLNYLELQTIWNLQTTLLEKYKSNIQLAFQHLSKGSPRGRVRLDQLITYLRNEFKIESSLKGQLFFTYITKGQSDSFEYTEWMESFNRIGRELINSKLEQITLEQKDKIDNKREKEIYHDLDEISRRNISPDNFREESQIASGNPEKFHPLQNFNDVLSPLNDNKSESICSPRSVIISSPNQMKVDVAGFNLNKGGDLRISFENFLRNYSYLPDSKPSGTDIDYTSAENKIRRGSRPSDVRNFCTDDSEEKRYAPKKKDAYIDDSENEDEQRDHFDRKDIDRAADFAKKDRQSTIDVNEDKKNSRDSLYERSQKIDMALNFKAEEEKSKVQEIDPNFRNYVIKSNSLNESSKFLERQMNISSSSSGTSKISKLGKSSFLNCVPEIEPNGRQNFNNKSKFSDQSPKCTTEPTEIQRDDNFSDSPKIINPRKKVAITGGLAEMQASIERNSLIRNKVTKLDYFVEELDEINFMRKKIRESANGHPEPNMNERRSFIDTNSSRQPVSSRGDVGSSLTLTKLGIKNDKQQISGANYKSSFSFNLQKPPHTINKQGRQNEEKKDLSQLAYEINVKSNLNKLIEKNTGPGPSTKIRTSLNFESFKYESKPVKKPDNISEEVTRRYDFDINKKPQASRPFFNLPASTKNSSNAGQKFIFDIGEREGTNKISNLFTNSRYMNEEKKKIGKVKDSLATLRSSLFFNK